MSRLIEAIAFLIQTLRCDAEQSGYWIPARDAVWLERPKKTATSL
jgi:hypothetical protein